jgi:hypothetical protein
VGLGFLDPEIGQVIELQNATRFFIAAALPYPFALRPHLDQDFPRLALGSFCRINVAALIAAPRYYPRMPRLSAEERRWIQAFGLVLCDLRRERGLTLREAARGLNIEPAFLRKMEQGRVNLHDPRWRQVVAELQSARSNERE